MSKMVQGSHPAFPGRLHIASEKWRAQVRRGVRQWAWRDRSGVPGLLRGWSCPITGALASARSYLPYLPRRPSGRAGSLSLSGRRPRSPSWCSTASAGCSSGNARRWHRCSPPWRASLLPPSPRRRLLPPSPRSPSGCHRRAMGSSATSSPLAGRRDVKCSTSCAGARVREMPGSSSHQCRLNPIFPSKECRSPS